MSATLVANIYGKPAPVRNVIEYGEHEVRFNAEDWQRVRYAVVNLDIMGGVVVTVPLEDLTITQPVVRKIDEECDICREMYPLHCDAHVDPKNR